MEVVDPETILHCGQGTKEDDLSIFGFARQHKYQKWYFAVGFWDDYLFCCEAGLGLKSDLPFRDISCACAAFPICW